MRFIGLTLCLLVSSLGARAQSAEDRVSILEARVKTLEEALRCTEIQPLAPVTMARDDSAYEKTGPRVIPSADSAPDTK